MTPVFTARRRAERFHTLVEGDPAGTSGTRFDDQLAVVERLRAVPEAPEPRPEFTADLRERLLAAADTLLVPSEEAQRLTLPPRRTTRDRRIAVAVGGLALVGATTSVAVAAQSAMPGDMLYPVKRVIERVETGLRSDDEAKGQTMLTFATDRLEEATTLSRGGDLADGDHVAQALVDFADQATVGSDLLLDDYDETGDEAAVEELRGFTSTSLQTLTELEPVLPDEARDELGYAVQVLDAIDHAAARACPSCRGGIDQIPPALLSAGSIAEPTVAVVPERVPGAEIRPGDGKRHGDSGSGGGKHGDGSQSADGQDSGSSDSGTGGGTPVDDGPVSTVVGGLTDTLTGKQGGSSGGSSSGSSGGGGGLTGVPPVDDTVDGVTNDLDGALPDVP